MQLTRIPDDTAPSGFATANSVRWGSHIAHFFEGADGLREMLVPYFKAGLENHECCLWVTEAPLDASAAREALQAVMPDLADRERAGQLEILAGASFYDPSKPLPRDELVSGLIDRANRSVAAGFNGLRTNGNCAWVGPYQWDDFQRYESLVQERVRGQRLICMCSYHSDALGTVGMMEVIAHHDLVLRDHREQSVSQRYRLRQEGLRQRTFDLAMQASQMGTWRYTLSDNVCRYDRNAQRLYGLTHSHFLHDEVGVKEKFHPDDLELMWSRVGRALEPEGDGRYEVEYRVKQLDGSWRWLSAWGVVEFEGAEPNRTAVAISGASRDLSDSKKAEASQQLLLDELNHRVKNILAAVQSIAVHTLHRATDLRSAQVSLSERIVSLARAHDLLIARNWSGADVRELIDRAMAPFAAAQVHLSGPSIDVSPSQALALSLGLHELSTNAAKYGALSVTQGVVDVTWSVVENQLLIEWRERGGPAVAQPTHRGFGSRLLEDVLAEEFGGSVTLDYASEGLRCSFVLTLSVRRKPWTSI